MKYLFTYSTITIISIAFIVIVTKVIDTQITIITKLLSLIVYVLAATPLPENISLLGIYTVYILHIYTSILYIIHDIETDFTP